MSGIFITLEGCEGVGKSTQLHLLQKYLEETNQKAVFTREPGGTPVAEKIREILLSNDNVVTPIVEAYLFAAARADHMANLVLPELQKGSLVICDRFIDSSLAYQGVARGLGIDNVFEINRSAIAGRMPDCTVFIDMDPAASWRKQKGRQIENDRLEIESAEFHGSVYRGYKELIEKDGGKRIVSVAPFADKMETHARIVSVLKERGFIK